MHTAAPPGLHAPFMALLQARRTVSPRHLLAPGPEGTQLHTLLSAAGHAPDHGRVLPWRFVLVPPSARPALGEAFAQALLGRDAQAGPEALARARSKALHAPVLLLLILQTQSPEPDTISTEERLLSAGCAVQNLLLAATALGFDSALTSGQALPSAPLRRLFGLGAHEQALCFINLGTAARQRPLRQRPSPQDYVQILTPGQGRTPWPAHPEYDHGHSPL